jgi:hypothetical protein
VSVVIRERRLLLSGIRKKAKVARLKCLHGESLVFCRREAQLGSRFETKVCCTAERLEERANGAKEVSECMQRVGNDTPGH